MLEAVVEIVSGAREWDWRLKTMILLLSVFASTYIVTSIRSLLAFRKTGDSKTPPMAPYAIPGAGNLFAFAFDTHNFMNSLLDSFGRNVPIRIRVLNRKIHLITGAENVQAMFRGSRDLTTVPTTILILENAFGSPERNREVFTRDNTGIYAQPLENSNPLESHNRVNHLVHKTLHNGFSGTGLADLAARFLSILERELDALNVGDEWVDIPDVYALVQKTVFRASVEAMYGPHLFRLNPDLTEDFWEFDPLLIGLFKNLPRFIIPRNYIVRDKLKAGIMRWHEFANENYDWDDEELRKSEWEEYFGSRIMRERFEGYSKVDGVGAEFQASNDLGLLWGANANVIPIIGWELIDTLIRPTLVTQCLEQIALSSSPSSTSPQGLLMAKILANPLLQSIYAEELRLRNGVMVQRAPIVDNFKLGNWVFPKNEMILASSWHEQRDRSVWNEGPTADGKIHTVDDFWAERFIVYPNDPASGPRRPGTEDRKSGRAGKKEVAAAGAGAGSDSVPGAGNEPKFTTESVNGSFIPYGGGAKICPGRFYAKQEAMGAHALFLVMFEIELKREENDLPQPNLGYFPFGVVPPLGKFPARMRKRKGPTSAA